MGGGNLFKALCSLSIVVVSDCTQWMMNVVKSLFDDDETLSRLAAQIGQLRSRHMLTNMRFLLPSSLRDKDRFLRIFAIVEWAGRIGRYPP